jgi:hypothetical protein
MSDTDIAIIITAVTLCLFVPLCVECWIWRSK